MTLGSEAVGGNVDVCIVSTLVVEATLVYSNPDTFLMSEILALPFSASYELAI